MLRPGKTCKKRLTVRRSRSGRITDVKYLRLQRCPPQILIIVSNTYFNLFLNLTVYAL